MPSQQIENDVPSSQKATPCIPREVLTTTVIGSMPKPDYLEMPASVVKGATLLDFVEKYNKMINRVDKNEFEAKLVRATDEALKMQIDAGIDVVTDGELRRDYYVFSFCRQLSGTDFTKLKKTLHRNGACEDILPCITGPLSRKADRSILVDYWVKTNKRSSVPVKMTIPGPMTIIDSMADEFYGKKNERKLFEDLVQCIRGEIADLVEAGCKNIQVDDPVLVRYPEKALDIGIEMLSNCFTHVPADVTTTVHICCGFPVYLDQTDYIKADLDAYIKVVSALDNCLFNQISIEDAHRRNPSQLFKALKNKTLVLGVIDVVKSRVETVDEIKTHIEDVLQYIPRERLVIAPDCGLIYLPRDILIAKLTNMVLAAKKC